MAGAFLAGAFVAAVFVPAVFFAGAFFAADFLAGAFLRSLLRRPTSSAVFRSAAGAPLDSRSCAATRNSSSASSTAWASGHGSETRSLHAMKPTCRWPSRDITVQLRPAPWNTGPMGSIFSIFAPRKYSGKLGPGTLEMTRLCTTGCRSDRRRREYMRTADPNTDGAANCAQSVRRLASSALVWSLATTFASRIASSRSIGSSMSVASDMNMPDTRLVPGRDSAAWTDIGTIAMSGLRGSSPRSSRYLRRAVEHTASTTSLTVVPNAFLTRLSCSRSRLVNDIDR